MGIRIHVSNGTVHGIKKQLIGTRYEKRVSNLCSDAFQITATYSKLAT